MSIPFWMPQVGPLERSLLAGVLDSNFLNDGEVTTEFERRLAQRVGARHVVAVTSGTAALYLAHKACGIGHGDEVIVPDVTFIATANAVSMTGATAVLVDVDPETLNLHPQAVRDALTPRTKAIVPVHVSGRPADLTSILAIAREAGIDVIEDAAQALLSRFQGRCLGTLGRAGCVSFSPNKTLSTGQGGAVFTDDDELHLRLRELKDQGRPARGTGGADVHVAVGFNFKLTNLQSAVGLGQLQQLDARVERLRALCGIYYHELHALPRIRLLPFDLAAGEVPQWIDAIADRRDELEAALAAQGMHCRKFWHPLHTQAPYRAPDAGFPNSSHLAPRALWLPSAFTIADDDARSVCEAVRRFYRAG